MRSKVDVDGLDDEKLYDLTGTEDCESDEFSGRDVFIFDGVIGWAYEEGLEEG
jgi:hypothetical protein